MDVEAILREYHDLGLVIVNMQGVVIDPSGGSAPACTCGKGCSSMGKHPLPIKGWNSITGPTPVRRLLSQRADFWERLVKRCHDWPDAEGPNFGLHVGASRLFVLDVDPRNGGDRSLGEFVGRHGPLPLTVQDRTGNRQGGGHFYFRSPAPGVLPDLTALSKQEVKAAIALAPGLEVFQGNHLLVIPPSMHAHGKRYEWVHHPRDVPFAPVPQGVVDAIWASYNAFKRTQEEKEPKRAKVTVASHTPQLAPSGGAQQTGGARSEVVRRATRYVERMPDAISGQDGSRRTAAVACKLVVGFGLSVAEALPVLEEWNREHARPQWSPGELLRKLEWASRQQGERGELLKQQFPVKDTCSEGVFLDLSFLDPIIAAIAQERKDAENVAAMTIVAARNDRSSKRGLRCTRPRSVILVRCDSNAPRQGIFRCEGFCTCMGCRQWRIDRELANLTLHLHRSVGRLFEMDVGCENFEAVRRRIVRMGGQYARCTYACDTLNSYLVTSAPHPDAIAVRPEVAVSTFHTLLHEWREQERPISTSRGWKLPVPERSSEWARLGSASWALTLEVLIEIAATVDANVVIRGAGGDGKMLAARDVVRSEWPEAIHDYVVACMRAGEVLPPAWLLAAGGDESAGGFDPFPGV